MKRTDIINAIIKKYKYKDYLEIGIGNPSKNFHLIQCDNKMGVDPARNYGYQMTSDQFFKTINPETTYDLIFIDGLHESPQVCRDIENSLDILSPNGTIVVHDCNPPEEYYQLPCEIWEKTEGSGNWNGDVWKAFLAFRQSMVGLEMFVIDCDWGVGVIRRGKQVPLKIEEEISYRNFDRNRIKWLNLKTPEWFTEWIVNEKT